jgi:DNA helicase MCM8
MLSFTHTHTHTLSQVHDGDQLRQLVHVLCPSIYGQELVKAGLLLALVGGVRKNAGSANKVPVRGDVHALMVGDPGLGKSQLLQVRLCMRGRCEWE